MKEKINIDTPQNNHLNRTKQSIQFKDNRSEATTQLKVQQMANQPIQRQANKTGMPDQLKSGIENLSGMDMSDVKVHYNSPQPAQLQAHAFAQGNQIHIASGQERHLPHEAWHVVQQKQGRVQPTKQLKSQVNINDDAGLEKEADVMGAKALQMKFIYPSHLHKKNTSKNVTQRAVIRMSKGTIINSELINPDGAPAKDGKVRKGAIAGGVKHDGGTPGTPYAAQVKKWSKFDPPWLGGHVYKHQWGGGRTVGNVVVWPQAAEDIWANHFEDRVQAFIDSGQSTSIGVSWSRDDELIPATIIAQKTHAKINPAAFTPGKYQYIMQKAEIDRRIANQALSYIPTSIAGSCRGASVVLGRSETMVNQAITGTINQIESKAEGFAKTYDNVSGRADGAEILGHTEAEHSKSKAHQNIEKFRPIVEGHLDELAHRGTYGNVTNTIDGRKL